ATTAGSVLGTMVTNATGSYAFPVLPLGPVDLSFQLDGFDNAVVHIVVQPEGESRVVQRLEAARISEAVSVVAKAPEEAPPPPPPPPVVIPVPTHDPDSVCGPA